MLLVAVAALAQFGSCCGPCGCGRYFAPDRELHRRIGEDEVTGTWCFNRYTVQLLARAGHPGAENTRIVLRPDGSCHFRSVLEEDAVFDEYKDVESKDCSWKLLWLKEAKVNLLDLEGVPMAGRSYDDGEQAVFYRGFKFTGTSDGLTMFSVLGDPDEWEFLEYIRCDEETP
ncbi:hypothetical protein ABI59_05625 [Acidobacteria bacterium Mor1]|nr:hypothetical protein ABI59_05625 [Acidobacteria bacterium Mor1]